MITHIQHTYPSFSYRVFSCLLAFTFLFSSLVPPQRVQAQTPAYGGAGVLNLPLPGVMVPLSPAYHPAMIKGIHVHPTNPLEMDFIIDSGDTHLDGQDFNREATKLIKYFLSSLTLKEEEMWVNLSPYEKDRMIPEAFSHTEMGRDLLIQDYLLKQLTASLIYPEDELGQKFWKRVYAKAQEQFGTTEIPMNTFNKIWIIPESAQVFEHDKGAFVVSSHLKVMLEEDYVALEQSKVGEGLKPSPTVSGVSSEIVREILIPEIEKEVNTGATFANLRQIFNSMILATWYKQNLKESLLGQMYVDQNKVRGVELNDTVVNQEIYERYVEAFKKGVYNYIKEDYDPQTQKITPRKYFSGGVVVGRKLRQAVDDGTTAASPVGVRDSLKGLARIVSAKLSPKGDSIAVAQFEAAIASASLPAGTVEFSQIELDYIRNVIKRNLLQIVVEKQRGHIGTYLSSLEILVGLYFGGGFFYDPNDPQHEMRDRFVLSKAHAGLSLYAVLAKARFFDNSELRRKYAQPGSNFPVMPQMNATKGVDVTMDHLGTGLSKGIGMAVSAKKKARAGKIVVLIGDGESSEGANQEAIDISGNEHQGLSNLIVIMDKNSMSLDKTITTTAHQNIRQRWESAGFDVLEINGHNSLDIARAMKTLQKHQDRPTLIIANTVKGYGVKLLANNLNAHYYRIHLHEESLLAEIERLEAKISQGDEPVLNNRIKEYQDSLRNTSHFQRRAKNRPDDAADDNESFTLGDLMDQPQDLIHSVLAPWHMWAAHRNPNLLAMSADVAPSVGMQPFRNEFGTLTGNNPDGRYVDLPMAESAMIRMAEGFAQEGFLPVVGFYETFLPMLLPGITSLLKNELPHILVATHSGLSQADGRGYQETTGSVIARSLPNLIVLEPSGPREAQLLLEGIILRNQADKKSSYYVRISKRKVTDLGDISKEDILKGFYEIGESTQPEAIIISMGVISHEVMKAKELLRERGIEAKVIVINNIGGIERQKEDFLKLISNGIPIFTVYDGSKQFLVDAISNLIMTSSKLLGLYGTVTGLGMDSYGANGSWEELTKVFGIDPEGITNAVQNHLNPGDTGTGTKERPASSPVTGLKAINEGTGFPNFKTPSQISKLLKDKFSKSRQRVLWIDKKPFGHGDIMAKSSILASLLDQYPQAQLTIASTRPYIYSDIFKAQDVASVDLQELQERENYDLIFSFHSVDSRNPFQIKPEVKLNPETIWIDGSVNMFPVVQLSNVRTIIYDPLIMLRPNVYRKNLLILRALDLKEQIDSTGLYINSESRAHKEAGKWLEERNIHADPSKRERSLVLIGGGGKTYSYGQEFAKGFTDMQRFSTLISEVISEIDADVLVDFQIGSFSTQQTHDLEVILSRNFNASQRSRIHILPPANELGKEEWMKYFIYLADSVLSVEGGNVHSAVAHQTPVVSVTPQRILGVHPHQPMFWEPIFANPDLFKSYIFPNVSDQSFDTLRDDQIQEMVRLLKAMMLNLGLVKQKVLIVAENGNTAVSLPAENTDKRSYQTSSPAKPLVTLDQFSQWVSEQLSEKGKRASLKHNAINAATSYERLYRHVLRAIDDILIIFTLVKPKNPITELGLWDIVYQALDISMNNWHDYVLTHGNNNLFRHLVIDSETIQLRVMWNHMTKRTVYEAAARQAGLQHLSALERVIDSKLRVIDTDGPLTLVRVEAMSPEEQGELRQHLMPHIENVDRTIWDPTLDEKDAALLREKIRDSVFTIAEIAITAEISTHKLRELMYPPSAIKASARTAIEKALRALQGKPLDSERIKEMDQQKLEARLAAINDIVRKKDRSKSKKTRLLANYILQYPDQVDFVLETLEWKPQLLLMRALLVSQFERVMTAVGHLAANDQEILEALYGLKGQERMSRKELGVKLFGGNNKQERVRQRENKVIGRLITALTTHTASTLISDEQNRGQSHSDAGSSPIQPNKPGGIDMNPNNLDLQTQGGRFDFKLPLDSIDLQNIRIEGFTPVIINVTPLTNLLLLLGLVDDEEADTPKNANHTPKRDPVHYKEEHYLKVSSLN